jgi:hypothetical protein
MPECPICHVPCFVSYVRAGDKFYECQKCFHIWCEETHTSISKEEYAVLLKIAEDAKDLLNAIKEGIGNDAYKKYAAKTPDFSRGDTAAIPKNSS